MFCHTPTGVLSSVFCVVAVTALQPRPSLVLWPLQQANLQRTYSEATLSLRGMITRSITMQKYDHPVAVYESSPKEN